jgi:CheY-like chemotaxis protein
LFVDDSLAFLEMFTEVCSILSNQTWEIHTAPSADRALALLQQHPIDLVVLDIVMPLVDGLQLLGIIGRRHTGVKIVVMTAKASEHNRATCLAGGAELFIEKPITPDGTRMVFNMLNDLVTWTRREGFSGALRHVGLEEVIQMECNARHSSILEIRNEHMRGEIYIEAGAIIHAVTGALAGEKAFNRLLSLRSGEFHLKSFKAPPQRTLHGNWEVLILEAARNTDEETSMITKKSIEEAAKKSAPNPPPEEKPSTLGDDIVVVATYDGKWHPQGETKR